MNSLFQLLFRIGRGERYQKSGKKDVVFGLAFMSSLPLPVFLFVAALVRFENIGAFYTWLFLVGLAGMVMFLFFTLQRIPSVAALAALTICQYAGAWFFIQSKI